MTRTTAATRKESVYKDLCDFFEQINIIKKDYLKKLVVAIVPLSIDETIAAAKVEGGFPLIDRSSLNVDVSIMKNYFFELLALIETRKTNEARAIRDIVASEGRLEVLLYQTVRQGFDTMDNSPVLSFLLQQTINPVLEVLSVGLKDRAELKQWCFGYCPLCGAPPLVGMFQVQSRSKYLICSACTTTWRFLRSRCYSCGTDGKIAYFMAENDPCWRVETCTVCNSYLKVIDQTYMDPEQQVLMAHLKSLHLDAIAVQKGYSRDTRNR